MTFTDTDWYDDYQAHEQRAERGLVRCDELDCPAVEAPQTDEQYRQAYLHWRFHGLLAGCSHAR